jgi:hypothetical protein
VTAAAIAAEARRRQLAARPGLSDHDGERVAGGDGDGRGLAAALAAGRCGAAERIKLKKRAIQGPFSPPVGATLTESGPGTTRSGTIGTCTGGERTLTCK